MRLRVLVPTGILVDDEATRIVAEARNGSFGILPRHVDIVTALVPGLLEYTNTAGGNGLVAVDEGLLVKQGPTVTVTTRRAVAGGDLGTLERLVHDEFERRDDRESAARTAIARLEASFVRELLRMEGAEP